MVRRASLMMAVLSVLHCGASENGLYYVCDPLILASSGHFCVFTASETVSWEATPHSIDCDASDPITANRCHIQSESSSKLEITPRPWTNGDKLVFDAEIGMSGYEWNYVLAAQLVFPLRNKLMFEPQIFSNQTLWDLYTQCFVDCDIKTTTKTDGQITAYSTSDIYQWTVDNSGSLDIHNYALQYLEEGAVELVCIMTNLEMDHCDDIRAEHGMQTGDVSNCWHNAYLQMFGVEAEYYDPPNTTTTSHAVAAIVTTPFIFSFWVSFQFAF